MTWSLFDFLVMRSVNMTYMILEWSIMTVFLLIFVYKNSCSCTEGDSLDNWSNTADICLRLACSTCSSTCSCNRVVVNLIWEGEYALDRLLSFFSHSPFPTAASFILPSFVPSVSLEKQSGEAAGNLVSESMLAPWPWVWKEKSLPEGCLVSLRSTHSRTDLCTLKFRTAESYLGYFPWSYWSCGCVLRHGLFQILPHSVHSQLFFGVWTVTYFPFWWHSEASVNVHTRYFATHLCP